VKAGIGLEHHVNPSPGLIVDQLPAMAAAGGVLGQQDVAGLQGEVLSAAGFKIERAAERNHELTGRRVMPIERAARSRLLKGNGGHRQLAGQDVAVRALFEIDKTFDKM
jgi:hypothetical protein